MIASVHHHNDDLLAFGVGLAIGMAILSGAVVLIGQPAIQALIAQGTGLLSQQVQSAFPHVSPMR